jgi:hypothetical protein
MLLFLPHAEVEVKKAPKRDDDQYKSKVKPRTIWDKPEILNLTDDSFTLKWQPSSIPSYAVQTPIWSAINYSIFSLS